MLRAIQCYLTSILIYDLIICWCRSRGWGWSWSWSRGRSAFRFILKCWSRSWSKDDPIRGAHAWNPRKDLGVRKTKVHRNSLIIRTRNVLSGRKWSKIRIRKKFEIWSRNSAQCFWGPWSSCKWIGRKVE